MVFGCVCGNADVGIILFFFSVRILVSVGSPYDAFCIVYCMDCVVLVMFLGRVGRNSIFPVLLLYTRISSNSMFGLQCRIL